MRFHRFATLFSLLVATPGCGGRPAPATNDGGLTPDVRWQPPAPRPPQPAMDAGQPASPTCGDEEAQSWKCFTAPNLPPVCLNRSPTHGLPFAGVDWTCHPMSRRGERIWICSGDVPNLPLPKTCWLCAKVTTRGCRPETPPNRYRCWRKESGGDRPSDGPFVCEKGTRLGGTRCTRTAKAPGPPGPFPHPSGPPCKPGSKRWCDGLQFSGWGKVLCKPDRTWATTMVNGRRMLDCQEVSSGARPATDCACHHFYFNPTCCEREDCVVRGETVPSPPAGAGKLCDPCNPRHPRCATGALCAVTNTMEAFCGRSCDPANPCPKGHRCLSVKAGGVKKMQCVPADFSCYL